MSNRLILEISLLFSMIYHCYFQANYEKLVLCWKIPLKTIHWLRILSDLSRTAIKSTICFPPYNNEGPLYSKKGPLMSDRETVQTAKQYKPRNEVPRIWKTAKRAYRETVQLRNGISPNSPNAKWNTAKCRTAKFHTAK